MPPLPAVGGEPHVATVGRSLDAEVPRPRAPERLASIDFLRGVAALAVVAYHAFGYEKIAGAIAGHPSWFRGVAEVSRLGASGVALFFVLSGYCIHLRWCRNYTLAGETRIDFRAFWRRRMWRLYPAYLAALTLTMSLVLLAYLSGRRDVNMLNAYPGPKPAWMAADYLAHLTMTHGLHPVLDKAGGNAVYWSLAREEYLYLMYFPLLAWRRTRGIASSLAVVTALGLACSTAAGLGLEPGSGWSILALSSAPVLWVQWCLGMVAVEAYYGLVRLPRWCSRGWPAALFGASALLCTGRLAGLGTLLWGLSFFVLLNHCVGRERTGRWPNRGLTGLIARVGVWSYSLYLVHLPVQDIVRKFIPPATLVAHPWAYVGYSLALGAAGCLAGWAFFVAVERRALAATAIGPHR